MKIEVLEQKLSSDGYSLEIGDRISVPDAIGIIWCTYGWAKDLTSSVVTNDRLVTDATIEPQQLSVSINQENQ